MGVIASILDSALFGVRDIFANAIQFPRRTALNFIGATLVDDPTNGWTLVQIPGVLGAGIPFVVDASSAPVAAGQFTTMAPGASTVTLATSATLALTGGVLAIAMTSGNPGQTILQNLEAMIPNSISGLGAGVESKVRLNPATSRAQRVASFSPGDFPLGTCNAGGDLLLFRGLVPVGTFLQRTFHLITTTTALTDTSDTQVVTNQSGAINVSLPPPTLAGLEVAITDGFGNAGAHPVTILPNAGETINGAASLVISFNRGSYVLRADGTNWEIIACVIALAGDTVGDPTGNTVQSLTGAAGTLMMKTTAALLQWAAATVNPTIQQLAIATNGVTGAEAKYAGQNATGTGATGGNAALVAGTGTLAYGNVPLRGNLVLGGFTQAMADAAQTVSAANSIANTITTTGANTAVRALTLSRPPTLGSSVFVHNSCTGFGITVQFASGTASAVILPGQSALVVGDGTNANLFWESSPLNTVYAAGVKDSTAWNTSLDSFTTTSYVDSGTYKKTIPVALAVGDLVEIDFSGFMSAGGTVDGRTAIGVHDGSMDVDEVGFLWDTASGNNQPVSASCLYTVASANAANNFIAKVRGKRISGTGNVNIQSQGSFVVKVYRPST